MRIAVIADSHFDEGSRFEECIRIHNWIAEDARKRGCTAWMHAGDVYERRSTPREREAVAAWVQIMADEVGPGLIVRGNHDALGDLPLLQRLDTDGRGVTVVEDARTVVLKGRDGVGWVSVACVGWPQKARLLALLPDAGKEAGDQAAGDAMRNVLRGLGMQLADVGRPNALLMHAMVRGSRTSVGQPLVGCDLEVGLDDLRLCRADTYLLGHIHMPQAFDMLDGATAIYPGSPRRTAFGETEDKSYVVAEFGLDRLISLERVITPCTPMILLNVEGQRATDGHWEWDDDGMLQPSFTAAEVRLRYEVASDQREAARAAAETRRDSILAAGAISVKLEEVVTAKGKARAPEVAKATTLEAKLDARWRATGFEPGSRRPALIGKVNQIEEEASHAA